MDKKGLSYERKSTTGIGAVRSVVRKTTLDGAWEQAWEAYQDQQKPGVDDNVVALRNRAKQENDARYLGPQYFGEVCQYLPKGEPRRSSQGLP